MTIENLQAYYRQADEVDLREGLQAYKLYNKTMHAFAEHYGHPLDRVCAVFCALSPNNDYRGNLRSLASVLDGYNRGVPVEQVTISTYEHCRDRAWLYLDGQKDYVESVTGPKILSFYQNILDPEDPEPVTIDGHMVCCWYDKDVPMKDALFLLRGGEGYNAIASGCRKMAGDLGLVPNQLQAILWFTRKRIKNIRAELQYDLWSDPDDVWGTFWPPEKAPPFPTYQGPEPRSVERVMVC